MAHTHKKGGGRKDKKTARMRQEEQYRHGMAKAKKPTTDQKDVQTHKPGHESDRNSPQNKTRSAKKKT